MSLGGFSLGSAFIRLGADALPEGFLRYGRLVGDATAIKSHDIKLGAVVNPQGFAAYGRDVKAAESQTTRFAGTTKTAFAEINRTLMVSSEAMARYVGMGRQQLGLMAGEYETVAAAAAHSAAQQSTALRDVTRVVETESKKQMASASKGLGTLAGVGKGGLIGVLVGGAVGAKMAGDFQKNMLLLNTEAGYALNGRGGQPGVKQLSQAVLDLAPKVGVGPNKLAEGLYHLASAGISAGSAMDVLKVAANGARIGNAGMEDVSNALAAIMKTAPKDIHGAADAMGTMIKIVGSGNLRMRDLVAAMTTGVVPAGKAVGLGLRDVGAALDVMTARGVPAEQASNRLRTTLNLIAHPTKKASDALAELGLSNTDLAKRFQDKGLVAGLETLSASLDKTFPKGRKLTVDEHAKAVHEFNIQLDNLGVTGKKRDEDLRKFRQRLADVGYAAVEQGRTLSDAFGGSRMGTTMQILMQNLDDLKGHFIALNKGGSEAAIKQFNKAVEETHQTFNYQMNAFFAGVQKIFIQVGTVLIPVIEGAIKGLDGLASWLGKNKTVAILLASTIGGLLSVAVLGFFAKLAIGLGRSTKDIGALMRLIFQMGDGTAALSKANTTLTGTMNAQAAAVDRVAASLGAEATAADAAAVSMGRLAATGEAVTAGGVVLPGGASRAKGGPLPLGRAPMGVPPIGGAVGSAEKVAGGGLKAGASKLLGRAGSGLLIGLGGTMAAQFVGSAIGGSTGKAVGSIGTDAAAGAGIGMLLGPQGALAGAMLGGLTGAFVHFLGGHKSQDYGKQIANQVEQGLGALHLNISPDLSAATRKNIESAGNKIQKLQAEKTPQRMVLPLGGRAAGLSTVTNQTLTPAQIHAINVDIAAEYRKIGLAAASAFNDGIVHGPKFQTAKLLTSDITRTLRSLPLEARSSAGKSMLEMAVTLEKQGRLPKGAVSDLVGNLAKEYGIVGPELTKITHDAMDAIANEMARNDIIKNTQSLVDEINKTFADAPKESAVSSKNVRQVWEDEMKLLREKMHSGNSQMRDDAKKMYQEMSDNAGHYSKLMRSKTIDQLGPLLGAWGRFSVAVGNAADSAASSVASSAAKIASDVGQLAGELGVKQGIKFTPSKTIKGQQTQSHVFGDLPNFADLGGVIGGRYGGGIANPGAHSAADDHYLVDPYGRPVAAMSGTEGVLNSPQMGIVDMSLQLAHAMGAHPYGGLNALWNSGMRHANGGGLLKLAGGGYVAPMGKSLNLGRVDMGVDFSGAGPIGTLGDAIFTRVSPQHSGTGWPGAGDAGRGNNGALIVYRLLSGSKKGAYVYTAENIDPVRGLHVGEKVKAGTTYARARGKFPFLEIGWARDSTGTTEAAGHYVEGQATKEGASFLNLISGLPGGPKGPGASGIDHIVINGPAGALRNVAQGGVNTMEAAASKFMRNGDDSGGGGGADANRSLAHRMMKKFWGEREWPSLNALWTHESGFKTTAGNTAFAYGVPQADPGTKMASYGGDWRTNPVTQINWGLDYIRGRYGSPSHAWSGWFNRFGPGNSGYATGGLLPGLTTGGKPKVKAHASGYTPPKPVTITVGGQHLSTSHKAGKPVLPKGLGNLKKFATIPGITDITDIDNEIGTIDNNYSRDARYLGLADETLTPEDLTSLQGIREQVIPLLVTQQGLIASQKTDLTGRLGKDQTAETAVRTRAAAVKTRIDKYKAKLKAETRRLAKLRHVKAGKMIALATALARRVAANADGLAAISKKQRETRRRFADQIAKVQGEVIPDNTPVLKAIRDRYKGPIAAAKTAKSRNIIMARRDAELAAARGSHKAKQDSKSRRLHSLQVSREHAMRPLQDQHAKLTNQTRHLRRDEAAHRHKYEHQGWASAWAIEVDQWKLRDKIDTANKEETALTGSTTGRGKGGILGGILGDEKTVTGAISTLDDKAAAIPGAIQDTAMDDLDLAEQNAQAQADKTGKDVDVFGLLSGADIDVLTGAAPAGMGFPVDTLHRIFKPSTSDTGKSPADIAAAVLAELAAFDSGQQSLYSQFGSNFVTSPSGLAAAFGPGGGGARFFGAAGNADLAPGAVPGTSNTFNQTNHYATGPDDPHVHAQVSRVEFSSAFG